MLHDLLKFHFKLMVLFHITFICTLYDIDLPNKYLSLYLQICSIQKQDAQVELLSLPWAPATQEVSITRSLCRCFSSTDDIDQGDVIT